MLTSLEDRVQSLEILVIALEKENKELKNEIEAICNELAYVDAYQDNLQCDLESVEMYVSEVEAAVNDLEDVIFFNEELTE